MNKFRYIIYVLIPFIVLYNIYINILQDNNIQIHKNNDIASNTDTNDVNNNQDYNNEDNIDNNMTYNNINTLYSFNNPILAYKILKELNFNYPIKSKKSILHEKRLKFIPENDYCDKALKYFIDYPDIMFIDNNYFTDYSEGTMVKKAIRSIGTDIQPKINYFAPMSQQKPFYFSLKITFFFITEYLHENMIMGQHFGCEHQLYNKMLRLKSLGNKADVAQHFENYLDKFHDRKHCVERYLPESYLLDNKTQCQNFFNYLGSSIYEQEKAQLGIIFIQKIIGKHMGAGLTLVDYNEEQTLLKTYNNGSDCGQLPKKYLQLQRYIPNPLLIYGHKFDFRVYMLVASVNPMIVYYHDGFLRVSLEVYNPDSMLKTTHFTNTHLAENIFLLARQNGKWNGMTEKELREFQSWNFTRLQNYLLQIKKINDENWIENGLRHQLKKAFIHIIRATQHTFMKRSNIYHLWGMDFMLDDNLKLWFIEANTRPALKDSSLEKHQFIDKLIKDHFMLMFAHLRSRMKKVLEYVNSLINIIPSINFLNEGIIIPNLEERRKEFNEINKNFMDNDFLPNQTSFFKVIDENLQGVNKYSQLISEECIDY